MRFGYARVSTREQHLDRQIVALEAAGVDPANIYQDKESGAKASRPALDELLKVLREGDTLVIMSFDRLARSTRQLLELSERFDRQGVNLVSLHENIDTTTPQGKLFFTISAAFAEFERELIKERQREGIETAKAKGVKFGRPETDPEDMDAAIRMYRAGGVSVAEICKRTGVSRAALYRKLKADGISRAASR